MAKQPTWASRTERDRQAHIVQNRRWREKNRAHVQQRERDYYAKNADLINERKKAEKRRLRVEVLQAYGGKCTCCGEARYEFLTFDHKNNDGSTHRKTISPVLLPNWCRKNGCPDSIQILCYNCNCAKGVYGICPHNQEPV